MMRQPREGGCLPRSQAGQAVRLFGCEGLVGTRSVSAAGMECGIYRLTASSLDAYQQCAAIDAAD